MNITWGILSKYRNELYGFSIIWIILFHGMNLAKTDSPKIFSFLKPFLKHGNCGVEIFLFLSGISLYFSMKNNNDIIQFYKNRLSRLIVPFFLIDGIYWGYTCLYKKEDFMLFFKKITFYSFWFEKDGLVWFVAFILWMYLLYPIIFHIIEKDKKIVGCIILIVGAYSICFILKNWNLTWFNSVEIALTRAPVFFLGCCFGKLVYDNKIISRKWRIVTLLLSFYGLSYFYQHPYSLVKYFRVTYFFVGPSLTLWIAIILDILGNKRINKLLCLWGGLSLELYLTHFAIRKEFLQSSYYCMNYKNNYYMYLLVCFLGAFLISKVISIIYRKYFK